MKGLLLVVVLFETGAGGCHDLSKHVAYSQNQAAIQTCKDKGGIAVQDELSDGMHNFPVLVRCDFALADAILRCMQANGVPLVAEDGQSLKSCTHPPTPEKP